MLAVYLYRLSESSALAGFRHVRADAQETQKGERAHDAALPHSDDQPEDDQAGHEQAATADPKVSETLHHALDL